MKKLAVLLYLLISSPALFAQWVELDDMSPQGVVREFLADGATLYVATDADGVFKSIDLGDTWIPASTGITDLILQSIAGSGSNLYTSSQGGGIFRSTDEGASWTELTTGIPEMPVFKVLVHGTNVFAAGLAGIYASPDSGATWAQKDSMATVTLAANGSTLFASGLNDGLHRSTDNGETWVKVLPEIPAVGSFGIRGNAIYLSSYSHGVMVSTNDGTSWAPLNNGFLEDAHPGIFAFSANTIFVGSEGQGLYRLVDGSTTWEQIPDMPNNSYIIALAIYHGQLYIETSFYVLRRPVSQLQDVERTQTSANISVFPNPARNSSTIDFTLDAPSQVKLSIVDALGRTLATLASETLPPGEYERQMQLQTLPNGQYFIRLQRGAITELLPLIVGK